MKANLLYTITLHLLCTSTLTLSAQNNGDYRSAGTGDWNVNATWERFDGAMWQPAGTPPASTDGIITIRSPHTVTANSVITADQVLVETGATLSNTSTFTIADGSGDDLVVNGILTNSSTIQGDGNLIINNNFDITGTIQGNGLLIVNGNTTWNSGTLDRSFTNQTTRTLALNTGGNKVLHAPLVNDGIMTWSDGIIIPIITFGGQFTNNGTFTITGSNLYQDNGGVGLLTNTGTITKTSAGFTTFNSLSFSNSGVINVNAGELFFQSGTFTNTNTISLTAAIFSNQGTFNHNTGSVIQGTGSFSLPTGILNLNIDLVFPSGLSFISSFGTVQGTGNLTVNNDFTFGGTIQGAGTLTVNGNTTWNAGTLDRSFTNQATRTLTIGTGNTKNLHAPLVNDGMMTWSDGIIVPIITFGGQFTNNGAFTITGNNLYQDNSSAGTLINNGTITKTSVGTTTFNNITFTNASRFDVNGSLTMQSGTFTNTDTLNLISATFTASTAGMIFNHNAGSVIQGTGSFSNAGIMNLNIDLVFSAAMPFSNSGTVQGAGNLTMNNDFTLTGIIQGNGSLTVNGNTTWNSGTLDRSFTNQATRTLTIGTGNTKNLHAPLVNNGMMTWSDGIIVPIITFGGQLTNNGTFTITGNNLYQDNSGTGPLINNGTITKTSVGTTTFNSVVFTNASRFDVNGTLFLQNGTFTNTDTLNLISATLTTGMAFNHNAGSVIQGTGSFSNTGIMNLNIDLVFSAAMPFSNSGTVQGVGNLTVNNNFTLVGTIQGAGTLTVNGNTTWNSGTLDRSFTNQATRTLTIGTGDTKNLHAPLVNDGMMTWSDGIIVPIITFGGQLTNNGDFTITGNNLYQDNGGTGTISNTGTITKTSTGTTIINSINFTNSGAIKGLGTIVYNAGTFVNNGSIDPGLSPGLLAFNNKQLFSANSQLNIEVASNNGPGTGHDQLASNMNPLTLDGTLTAILTGGFEPAQGTQYSVLTYPSRTGTFSAEPPCWIVTYNATNTTITYNPTFFDVCANDVALNTTASLCSGVANYTVSAIGTPTPVLTYTFAGATTGSGSGTGSGSAFNEGVTTVTILADNGCSGDTCSFLVTVTDIELPDLDCPDNISVSNDPGQCSAEVDFLATATDNCAIASITYVPVSGSVFPIGMTMVTATATDVNGNSSTCTFQVTVNDTENPVVGCPGNITVNNTPGVCGAVVNYVVTTDDNCAGEILFQTGGLLSGSTFPVGVTTNTFLATDASGNTTTCSFTVTVNDTELPVITCPNNMVTSNTTGICGKIINYNVPTDDNCPNETLIQLAGLPSGSTFPVGTTINTFRATDASGNTVTCSFTVTVNDTEPPSINCPNNISANNGAGLCGAVVNYTVTKDDNCTGEMLTQIGGLASGSTFPIGVTTNTFLATDASGNTSTCSFTVTINDTQLPTIDCPDDIVVNEDPNLNGAVVNYTVATDDNCTGETLTQIAGLPSGSLFPVGTTTNTFEVEDASGNTATCSFDVTVIEDGGAPIINCPDDLTINLTPGECTEVVLNIDPIVSPPDTPYTYTLTGATMGSGPGSASGQEFNIGITTVTYTITGAGIQCLFTVTIVGNAEVCNGIDDDCDGLIDDDDPDVTGQSTWYADTDADGYGDPVTSVESCDQPTGHVSNDEDCDDTDENVNPDAQEICNGLDDDCDGLIDDDDPSVSGQSTWYADADADGYGDPGLSAASCNQPTGYVTDDQDCDDTDENINPDAQEVCNGLDDDCDGLIDDDDPSVSGQSTWYADTDGDGFGDPGTSVQSCDQPTGHVSNDEDCDDTDENINPGAQEICNGLDDDCDGLVDNNDPSVSGQSTWYLDGDGDGYGEPDSLVVTCDSIPGYTLNDGDCDDSNPAIHPGAAETCNSVDDDCDGLTDEGVLSTWYQDADGDGFGHPGVIQMACTQPSGYVPNNTDCNDGNPAIHPGAPEVCNGVDDDCDGTIDEGCPSSGETMISIEDTTIVLESSGLVYVNVYLSAPSTQVVKVSYKTMNGTAKKITDYTATTGILRFLPGQTLRTIRVLITIDATPEPDEYFKIVLSDPVNASVDQGIGIIIITEMGIESRQGGNAFQVESRSSVQRLTTEPVVPNPQSKYTPMQVFGMTDVNFDMMLTDFNGRMIMHQKPYKNDWSMAALSTGIYFYHIVYRDENDLQIIKTGKLVIVD